MDVTKLPAVLGLTKDFGKIVISFEGDGSVDLGATLSAGSNGKRRVRQPYFVGDFAVETAFDAIRRESR